MIDEVNLQPMIGFIHQPTNMWCFAIPDMLLDSVIQCYHQILSYIGMTRLYTNPIIGCRLTSSIIISVFSLAKLCSKFANIFQLEWATILETSWRS